MLCPMKIEETNGGYYCIDDCAWWNKHTKNCAILQMSIELNCNTKEQE